MSKRAADKVGETILRPTGGPFVWYAYVFTHHPDSDEIGRFWMAWDRTGAVVYTKCRQTLHDLRRLVHARFQTGELPCFMVRVAGEKGGLLGPDALEAVRKQTVNKE